MNNTEVTSMGTKLLTIDTVAKLLYCSKSCVYKMIQEDALPAVKIGHRYLIPDDDLEKWIHARSSHPYKGGK